ncbi:MAG: DUF4156 domain-containing protein [Ottowia sp.]|nr:DUF4156 domain-containing protein [Ottowia sp.]
MKMHYLASAFVVMLSGCAAVSVNPGSAIVRVTHVEPGKECKFLGDATGNQGNFFTGSFTSNADLETGARNDLKNKAAAMGGNVVSILTHRAGQTGSRNGGSEQTNVIVTGDVYRCP